MSVEAEHLRDLLAKAEQERDKVLAENARLTADYGERGDLLAECRVRVSELEAELKEFQVELQEQVAKRLEAHKRTSALEALLAECETMLVECSDDLAEWIEAHYGAIKHYPSEKRRYERDMDTSVRADALVAKLKARTADAE